MTNKTSSDSSQKCENSWNEWNLDRVVLNFSFLILKFLTYSIVSVSGVPYRDTALPHNIRCSSGHGRSTEGILLKIRFWFGETGLGLEILHSLQAPRDCWPHSECEGLRQPLAEITDDDSLFLWVLMLTKYLLCARNFTYITLGAPNDGPRKIPLPPFYRK